MMYLRIRLNSNKDITWFPAMYYAKKWKEANLMLTDDPVNRRSLEIQVQDGLFDENDDNTDGSHKVYLDGSNLF